MAADGYDRVRAWGAQHADALGALGLAGYALKAQCDAHIASGGNAPPDSVHDAALNAEHAALAVTEALPSGDAAFDAELGRAVGFVGTAARLVQGVVGPGDARAEMFRRATDANVAALAHYDLAIERLKQL